jgi:3-deoxy-D-manno-octulosonic acid (KDO) 8-phosphate synthase
MDNIVKIGNISIGHGSPLILISGPCLIENYETTYNIASFLKELTHKLDIPFIFKASYDKANRTSIAVGDAHKTVLKNADMVTSAKGVNSAVREACEAILKTQGLWENILERFL